MKSILIAVVLAGFTGSAACAVEFDSLNVSADQLKAAAAANTAVALPKLPKAEGITFGRSELAGLQVLSGKIKPGSRLPGGKAAGTEDVNGDVSAFVQGVALHTPSLRNIRFLALTGDEVMQFRDSNTQRALLQNMRATALCNFLGYGKALLTTVASESVDRISLLNIEPSGALTQNSYEYSLRFDVSHYIKYYPAFLAEVVCAPRGS